MLIEALDHLVRGIVDFPRALRTVIGSLAGDSYIRVDLVDADEAR